MEMLKPLLAAILDEASFDLEYKETGHSGGSRRPSVERISAAELRELATRQGQQVLDRSVRVRASDQAMSGLVDALREVLGRFIDPEIDRIGHAFPVGAANSYGHHSLRDNDLTIHRNGETRHVHQHHRAAPPRRVAPLRAPSPKPSRHALRPPVERRSRRSPLRQLRAGQLIRAQSEPHRKGVVLRIGMADEDGVSTGFRHVGGLQPPSTLQRPGFRLSSMAPWAAGMMNAAISRTTLVKSSSSISSGSRARNDRHCSTFLESPESASVSEGGCSHGTGVTRLSRAKRHRASRPSGRIAPCGVIRST